MKKLYVVVASMLSMAVVLAQQPLNNSFENWSQASHPDNWGTLTKAYAGIVTYTTLENKETDMKHVWSGTSSLRLVTDTVNTGGPTKAKTAGRACYGNITSTGGAPVYTGVPYTQRPDSFVFFFQYKWGEGGLRDTAYAELLLTKYENDSTKIIGLAPVGFSDTATRSWYKMIVPVQYLIAGKSPDSIRIRFFSSAPQPISKTRRTGTTLWIDDVTLIVNTPNVGIADEKATAGLVKAFPNPVKDVLRIAVAADLENSPIDITDVNGRLVASDVLVGDKLELNTTTWKNGLYFYNIRANDGLTHYRGQITVAH